MTTPYRPGVLSRFLDRVDRLPFHGWWVFPLEFDSTKVVSDALAGVSDLRKRIFEVPTWPWRPQVLSGFLSALLLPVAVYLLTRAIGSQIGP